MRDYTKLQPLIWSDARFQALKAPETKLAALYIIAGPHQNSSGAYRIPEGYASTDLGWEPGRFAAAREEIIESGLILYDSLMEEAYVVDWFASNPLTNKNHAKGTLKHIYKLRSDLIREAAEADFDQDFQRFKHEQEINAANRR